MIDTSTIPKEPGCYLFKDGKGIILYVGKAKDLRKRVASYFSKTHEDKKTAQLVARIRDMDFIITDSEVEALILENNLIKKHEPKYNILLKDSKRYAYLQITKEDFPRLVLARKREEKGKYYGPFVSAVTRDYVLMIVRKVFKLRTCRRMPKRACLRYHIKICDAPCEGRISKTAYAEKVKDAEMALQGKNRELVRRLKEKMKKESSRQEYERALEVRNQIQAVEWLREKQNMEREKKYNEDIINFVVKDGRVLLVLFNIHKGILENKQEFEFDEQEGFLRKFVTQYYSEKEVPKELIVPRKLDGSVIAYLSGVKGLQVRVVVPKIGEKKQLLMLVKKNIEAKFFGSKESLEELRKKLRLQDVPKVIECFDISHLSGTAMTASMVQFRDGRPDKSNYRRFKIRTVEGVDDFKAIGEVVRRRYSRLLRERREMPNLVVIDGGKGQLHAALQELEELGMRMPIISLAKKFEEIYVPGLRIPIRLDDKNKALRLLQRVRDEAHRFAISYNRLLRLKKVKDKNKK